MTSEPLLRRLREELSPPEEARTRVRMRVLKRIDAPEALHRAVLQAMPEKTTRTVLWQQIAARITHPKTSGIFEHIRAVLAPADDRRQAVKIGLFARLAPVQVHASYRAPKWVAAFALVLVAVRISPMIFLAPSSSAKSSVILLPTYGEVAVSMQGYWQPFHEEIEVQEGVRIRTGDGEVTMILHDDGTIRLAPHTVVLLHDVSNRPEASSEGPTLTLESGRIWFQGLLPQHVRGMSVAILGGGEVIVHGGSVALSAKENGEADVRVWDRHAIVQTVRQSMTLVAGERTTLAPGEEFKVRSIANDEYDESWVVQNLRRDAVHQREIAQMQQERRAARAGILPSSRLYPVKRVAEKMDMFMTLDAETRIQKKLDLASTRLDEAAALIAGGQTGAELSLQEFKQAIIEVASGTGDTVTEELLRQKMAEDTADLAASLPDNASYLLKKTVLEASADLSLSDVMDESDVEGVLLLDSLDVLREAIDSGDTERARETYETLKPYLSTLSEEENRDLKPEVKKEVLTLLTDAAESLQEQVEEGTGATMASEVTAGLQPYLPQPQKPTYVPLSDKTIDGMVAAMKERIYVLKQPRSRWNQLQYEMARFDGHPDEGRILRRLYHILPENGLAQYVRTAIQQQKRQQEAKGL